MITYYKQTTTGNFVVYTLPGCAPKCHLRYKVQDGKHLIGCSVCLAYAANGHKLHGRQALGRFELQVLNPNQHSKNLLSEQTRKATGDHARAPAWQCDPEAVEVKKRPRDHVRTSAEEENIVFLAYVCLKLGLSLKEFETMARCVHSLSANTPAAYMSCSCQVLAGPDHLL